MNILVRGFGLFFLCLALLIAGCSSQRVLMPTPNVYLDSDRDFFGTLDPSLESTEAPLFFITDRAPERDEEGNLRYGSERSASLAFGKVVVDLGRDATWEELVEASRTQQRVKPFALEILEIEELVRSAETPLPFTEVEGQIVLRPDVAAQLAEAKEEFRRLLVRQLELTPRKEVFIFVLEYSNSNLAIVNFPATSYQGDRYDHSYFRDAPSVSSDLVLMLRDDLDPGPPGRPLESLGRKFWRVPPGYPALRPPEKPAANADRGGLPFN